ncbi:hypothetical protein [Rhizobium sp. HT1-10]|uniref:hypothetical protein n=1 Tax=Rhizobium sp. HT1-10 TaxID=3111638 RepID=UPI003C23811F
MTSMIRRFFGIPKPQLRAEPHLEAQYRETAAELSRERQEFRQKVQDTRSGAEIMRTWDDALAMVQRGRHEN